MTGRNMFAQHNYEVIEKLISREMLAFIRRHLRMLERNHGFTHLHPAKGALMGKALAVYAPPFAETLLEMHARAIAKVVGCSLEPSYSFARIYLHGSALKRHTDREAGEIGVSVNASHGEDASWPIYLRAPRKSAVRVNLQPGDALVFAGTQLEHWRDRFPGRRHEQILLFYVRKDGAYQHLKHDKRQRIGAPPFRERFLDW